MRTKYFKKNTRETRQRKIIFEELCRLKTHPTAEELFFIVKKRLPSISLGTVYRNLDILKKQNKILELYLEKNFNRYDSCIEEHYHFYCNGCKKIFDIPKFDLLKNFKKIVEEKTNSLLNSFSINFYGFCNKCKNRQKN